MPKKTGVNHAKINMIREQVSKYKHESQSYHNLLMDEKHVSQKLVYEKSTGNMNGYIDLEDVQQEMNYLVQKVNTNLPPEAPPIATKMLSFMVKGVVNGIKETVAHFPVNSLTKELLYDYTWEVIAALELAGVKVLSVIADGNAVHRGFFDLHKPAHEPTESKVVYSTVNLCAP